MLDNFSSFPAPNREDAVKQVIAECKKQYPGKETKLKEITERVISEMPSLGSYAGWNVGFKHDAIQKVHDQMHKVDELSSELIYY
jgi:hypothetical protein